MLLEKHYNDILEDFYATQHKAFQWPERKLNPDAKWTIAPVYGKLFDESSAERTRGLCRETWGDNFISCAFSIMQPGAYIRPHVGKRDYVRHQLGLIIPSNDHKVVGLEANGVEYSYEEGKVFTFDNLHKHSAWNYSDDIRVVLIIDTERE